MAVVYSAVSVTLSLTRWRINRAWNANAGNAILQLVTSIIRAQESREGRKFTGREVLQNRNSNRYDS